MRKKFFRFLTAVLLLTAVSCENDSQTADHNNGSITISFSMFSNEVEELEQYNLSGIGPGGATFERNNISKETKSITIDDLTPGSWSIFASGKNVNDEPVVSGSVDAEIIQGENTTADILLKPVGNNGTLLISISWPADLLTNPSLTGNLISESGESLSIHFAMGENELSGIYSNSNLSYGYYTLSLSLKQGDFEAWNFDEYIQIAAGEVTSVSLSLNSDDIKTVLHVVGKHLIYKSIFQAESVYLDESGNQKIHNNEKQSRFMFFQTLSKVLPGDDGKSVFAGLWANELIRFQFTENYLNVIKIIPSKSSSIYGPDNITAHETIIIRYPVDRYVDILKSEDHFLSETFSGIETEDLNPWHLRKYAVIKFENEEILDMNIYKGHQDIYKVDVIAHLSPKADMLESICSNEIINISLGKTILAYHGSSYSENRNFPVLVKSSYLPEPETGYTPMEYPEKWQKKMGFFASEIHEKMEDGSLKKQDLINRFNPYKPVTFYLSKNLSYMHNLKYRELAYRVVDRWNKVFEKTTGRKKFIILKDSDGSQTLGDLRYNMIHWIDEVDKGPLAYGPSFAHAETGEILSANVVINGGALRSLVAHSKLDDGNPPADSSIMDVISSDSSSSIKRRDMLPELSDSIQYGSDFNINYDIHDLKKFTETDSAYSFNNRLDSIQKIIEEVLVFQKMPGLKAADVGRRFQETKNIIISELAEDKKVQSSQTVGCLFEMPVDKIRASIAKGVNEDVLIEEILVGALTHQLGHNFGLRHNFRGSMDEKNFPGNHEHEEEFLDEDGQARVHSSSIMDYLNDSGHEPDRPGRYDEEAIKIVYSQKTLAGANTADFSFEFCTDNQAYDIDPYCNAFDRGTTAGEIVDNIAHDYHEYYKFRNFGSEHITEYQVPGDDRSLRRYLKSIIKHYMIPARKFADYRTHKWFEKYIESGSNAEFADNHPEILELNEGVISGFNFLLSVIFNDREDLDKLDPFDFTIDVRGVLYDRLFAQLFLSLESVGMWEGNFTSIVTYPDLFEETYFKEQGYSEEKFFEIIGSGLSGRYQKFNYENRGFIGESNFMRHEFSINAFEILLESMNTEGSAAIDHSRISVENLNDSSKIKDFIEETKNNLVNELLKVNINGHSNLDYDMGLIKKLNELLAKMKENLPQIPEDSVDKELKSIFKMRKELSDDIESDVNYSNQLVEEMASINKGITSEALSSISGKVYSFVWRYIGSWFLYEDVVLKAYNKFDADGLLVVDENGKHQLSDIIQAFNNIQEDSSKYIADPSSFTALDMVQNYSKMELATEADTFFYGQTYKFFDRTRQKLIEIPENARTTGVIAGSYYESIGVLHSVFKIYEFLVSKDPDENRLGLFLKQIDEISDDQELFDILDFYPDYLRREKDYIYTIFDIYSKYVPGVIVE